MEFFCGDEGDFRITHPTPVASTHAAYHGSPADLYLFDADRPRAVTNISRLSLATAAETSCSLLLNESPGISHIGIHSVSPGLPVDGIASAFVRAREHGVVDGSQVNPCHHTESPRLTSGPPRQKTFAVSSSDHQHRSTIPSSPNLRELSTVGTSLTLPHGSTTSELPHVREDYAAAPVPCHPQRATLSSLPNQRGFEAIGLPSAQHPYPTPFSRPTNTTTSLAALRKYVDTSRSIRILNGAGPSRVPRSNGDEGGSSAAHVPHAQLDRFEGDELDAEAFEEQPILPSNEMGRLLRAQRNREAAHRSRVKNKLRQTTLEAETTRLLQLHQELRRLLSFLIENFNPGFRGHGIAASILPYSIDHTVIPQQPLVIAPWSEKICLPQSSPARNDGDPKQK